MRTKDYEKMDRFLKTYEELREELGSKNDHLPENIGFYACLYEIAKARISRSIKLPRHIRKQAGIEIVNIYMYSPFESVKVYEIAGRRPSFDKLSKFLEENGFRLKKVDSLGEMFFHLFPFGMTEDGI
jgi:effector-binding domain-containing protein